MQRHVIYIPGLGDQNFKGQAALISTWRLWGVRPHMVRMRWSENEPFDTKLQRVLELIDSLHAEGHSVSLVGASAGAGAVINAFAARKDILSGVVLIAGWVNHPEKIGPSYRRGNSAFVDSAYLVQSSLDTLDFDSDRPRIYSRYAIVDPVVPRTNSVVGGARNRTVFGFGHSVTIATQLLFGAPFFLRWLKMLESKA